MKRNLENSSSPQQTGNKLRNFFDKQTTRIKRHQFTCPICREVLQGLSEFGAHLKRHCT